MSVLASPTREDGIETVSAFTRRVKTVLEAGLRPGWVRGEVSNLRAQSSGHLYFSLKDAGAQLSCVLFRGDAVRQTVRLRDGQQVVAFGNISVYEARGQYQLVVRALVEDGVGKLQREFEALKQKLAGEGLFDPARKRPLPESPRVVGFITSPTGAAVHDFIRIMSRREWCGRLIVLPVRVQGAGAASEVAGMLELAGRLNLFDVLVVGRGGGSLEDLWAFNEEVLVRAVAACPVPVISAVGHEIDFTLCDFAADVRAETPSGAAELISSRCAAWAERIRRAAERLTATMEDAHATARDRVGGLKARLRLLTPTNQLQQGWLRRDDLVNRLHAALHRSVQARREELRAVREKLDRRSPEWRVQMDSHRLLGLWKRLQSASPASVLQRGFAIVRDEQGRPVMRRQSLQPAQAVTAEFADGSARLRVEGTLG
jgi:exodeoxyribonuclease VII large subunit